ncbi:TetR/AcrR family transcriptional regulator [Kineococcus terrestris]|uniref:TetR/AcrR family transcriptional regulator n=1 Tax=Kineococcus terrestris TaxID=2044856 RepID=UPI0034DB5C62
MPAPATPLPTTRERLLDAFAAVVVATGPRSATLEAVAAEAGVSKGGLLYHFATKDALVDALLARAERVVADDLAAMREAPEGAAVYYVRTSLAPVDDPLHRAMVAVLRLAQDGDPRAAAGYAAAAESWRALIEEQVGDPALARTLQLVGDGLWGQASTGAVRPALEADLDGVLAVVARLAPPRP